MVTYLAGPPRRRRRAGPVGLGQGAAYIAPRVIQSSSFIKPPTPRAPVVNAPLTPLDRPPMAINPARPLATITQPFRMGSGAPTPTTSVGPQTPTVIMPPTSLMRPTMDLTDSGFSPQAPGGGGGGGGPTIGPSGGDGGPPAASGEPRRGIPWGWIAAGIAAFAVLR